MSEVVYDELEEEAFIQFEGYFRVHEELYYFSEVCELEKVDSSILVPIIDC